MAAMYTDPSASDKDMVRFLISDTVATFLLTDEEILALLALYSVNETAAKCAESISLKYARLANQSVGSVSINYRDVSAQYKDMADRLRTSSADCIPYPVVGGISIAEKAAEEEDADRVEPFFGREDVEP